METGGLYFTHSIPASAPGGERTAIWHCELDGSLASELLVINPMSGWIPYGISVSKASGLIYFAKILPGIGQVPFLYLVYPNGTGETLFLNSQGGSIIVTDPLSNDTDGRIYCLAVGFWGGTVQRVKKDGTSQQTVSITVSSTGISIDESAGKIYYATSFDNSIKRANVDGTSQQTLLSITESSLITIDSVNGLIFFGDLIAGNRLIRRANTDGSGVLTLVDLTTLYPGNDGLYSLRYNSSTDQIFFSTGLNIIYRANIDGTGLSPAFTSPYAGASVRTFDAVNP